MEALRRFREQLAQELVDAQLKLNEVRDEQVFRERQCAMLARKLDVLREGQKILGLLKALLQEVQDPDYKSFKTALHGVWSSRLWRDPETGAVGWNSAPSDACIYFDSTHAHLFLNDDKNTDEEKRAYLTEKISAFLGE